MLALWLIGCAGSRESAAPDPALAPRAITTLLDQPRVIGFDQVVMTYVGRGVSPTEFRRPLDITEPTEVRCQVSYQKLLLNPGQPSGAMAVNFIVSGKGFGVNCQESLYESTFRKEVVCKIAERGELDLRVQSANPALAMAVGFICTKSKLEVIAQAPTPPLGHLRRLPGTAALHPRTAMPGPGPGPAPAPGPGSTALTRQLVSTSDGTDDKHKVLTLSPCSDPLWSNGTKGTASIGKSGPRVPFTVVDSGNCDIEVSGVADGLLVSDSVIKLQARAR